MRRLLAALLLSCIGIATASAHWINSYDQALQASRESGRPVLLLLTGDWSNRAQRLDLEVIRTPTFEQWASHYAVLLAPNYPRGMQPENIQRQDALLAQKYKVYSFPQVVVLTSEGKVVARQDYERGGARRWIGKLEAKIDRWLARNRK